MRKPLIVLALSILAPSGLPAQAPVKQSLPVIGLLLAGSLTNGDTTTQLGSALKRWSVALGLPSGGGVLLGVWWRPSARINLGLTLGAELSGQDEEDESIGTGVASINRFDIQLTPSMRVYVGGARSVMPFLLVRAGVRFSGADTRGFGGGISESDTRILLAGGALGAEWFPVSAVSFSAWTGLQMSHLSRSSLSANRRTETRSTTVATLTSALTFQLYF